MSRPETQLKNTQLLNQYISTLERQLAARKKENEQMQKYFEQSLPFVQQVNEALQRTKAQNNRYKGIVQVLNAKLRELGEENNRLGILLVDSKNKEDSLVKSNQCYLETLHEKEQKIEKLTKNNANLQQRAKIYLETVCQQDEKQLDMNQHQIKQKQSKLQINKLAQSINKLQAIIERQQGTLKENQNEIEQKDKKINQITKQNQDLLYKASKYQGQITSLKTQYQDKEQALQNYIQSIESQRNYYIQRLNFTNLYAQLQQKDQFIASITQEAYKTNLSGLAETIKNQKIAIDNLKELLDDKEKEIQSLQNSNSVLRKLKINWTNNEESFDSLQQISGKLAQAKGVAFSLQAMEQSENELCDKLASGKTLTSLNLNLRRSRNFQKIQTPVKLKTSPLEDTNTPTSAQDRKHLSYK